MDFNTRDHHAFERTAIYHRTVRRREGVDPVTIRADPVNVHVDPAQLQARPQGVSSFGIQEEQPGGVKALLLSDWSGPRSGPGANTRVRYVHLIERNREIAARWLVKTRDSRS